MRTRFYVFQRRFEVPNKVSFTRVTFYHEKCDYCRVIIHVKQQPKQVVGKKSSSKYSIIEISKYPQIAICSIIWTVSRWDEVIIGAGKLKHFTMIIMVNVLGRFSRLAWRQTGSTYRLLTLEAGIFFQKMPTKRFDASSYTFSSDKKEEEELDEEEEIDEAATEETD